MQMSKLQMTENVHEDFTILLETYLFLNLQHTVRSLEIKIILFNVHR
jgi:hypothetical protein